MFKCDGLLSPLTAYGLGYIDFLCSMFLPSRSQWSRWLGVMSGAQIVMAA